MLIPTDFEKLLFLYKVESIECPATYHTIVQTYRMMGIEVLKYFQAFFRKFFYEKCDFSPRHNKQACSVHSLTKSFDEGCHDFHEMMLGQLAIV